MNNHLSKLKTQGPNPGRPLEQSPVRLMCSKCGMSTDVHDIDFCKRDMKRPNLVDTLKISLLTSW